MRAETPDEARPGFATMNASEYEDTEPVLEAKIQMLAHLVRKSRYTVAYTGAGISTAAGIKDYASKARGSLITQQVKDIDPLDAEPTKAHCIITAMHRAKLLHHWVQQNHDGLPQKAGFPQKDLNEIHGSWFDPSNPIVHFGAKLRPDLFTWMLDTEEAAELTLAIGTACCNTPSTADRLVVTCAGRVGSVIIGLQRTRLDQIAGLKIYGLIDNVLVRLSALLGIDASKINPSMQNDQSSENSVDPSHGSLEEGTQVYPVAGPYKGIKLTVGGAKKHHVELAHSDVKLFSLGRWWFDSNARGSLNVPVAQQPQETDKSYMDILNTALCMADLYDGASCRAAPDVEGVWEGSAVLGNRQSREEHPTASADRQQPLRLLLVKMQDMCFGAGFTTWPAANVLSSSRGHVFFTVVGRMRRLVELVLTWEPCSGSEVNAVDGFSRRCVLRGSQRNDEFGGIWMDMEGVDGAFLLRRTAPLSKGPNNESLCIHNTFPKFGAAISGSCNTGTVQCLRGARDHPDSHVVHSCECKSSWVSRTLDFAPSVFSYSIKDVYRPWAQFQERWRVLRKHIHTCSTLLDFGSGSGWFSLQAAAAFPDLSVVSVEGSVGAGNGTVGESPGGNISSSDAICTHQKYMRTLQVRNHIVPEAWSCPIIESLCEQGPLVDVVVAFAAVHYIPRLCGSPLIRCVRALLSLCNVLIVELPPESVMGCSVKDLLQELHEVTAEHQLTSNWFGECETWTLRRKTPMQTRGAEQLLEKALPCV